MTFEQHLANVVKNIRKELQQIESISSFEFVIKATGRVHEGEVEITFKLEHGYYGGTTIGNSVNAVVEEFMRRTGWDKRHMPLTLPNVEDRHDTQAN